MSDRVDNVRLYGNPEPVEMMLEFLTELRRRKLLSWHSWQQDGKRLRVSLDVRLQ